MPFTATVLQSGATATGIPVPPEAVDALGAGKRPAVRVTVNGYTYRSTVATLRGVYMIPLSAEHRQAAGVAAGDEVSVDLELDTAPREVDVPADLAAALSAAPAARQAFEALSYSNRRAHVLAVEGAKTDATRQRRIAGVVERLGAQRSA